MKITNRLPIIFLALLLFVCTLLTAQIAEGVYHVDQKEAGATVHHELKLSKSYFIHSVYEKEPAKFIKTLGGFYTAQDTILKVQLEFNSDHEKDQITSLTAPYTISDGNLILDMGTQMTFVPAQTKAQDLDGPWLFATRGPDNGQERRGESHTRKTLKFLLDGRFQWIAYDTDGFQFKGTGGGRYTADANGYTEHIEYFSRDNSRVGATLKFEYEVKDNDWHHRGKNSKGEPMYEIWGKRVEE